jgi:poly-beta-1,6-N-acetyl-D-glucosamine synthase
MSFNLENTPIRKRPCYILITPARNEENFITFTIESIIKQTTLPLRWIIISDGSTDRTDEIVRNYEVKYDFINLITRKQSKDRNFASKVNAIQEGYESIRSLDFDFVGCSDADVTFPEDFFESILTRMAKNPQQGIGGGVVFEKEKGNWKAVQASYSWSVAGAMQMFRRQCYEQINGYQPLKRGGIDAVAEIKARMCGWEVRTFEDLKLYHHRFMGNNGGNRLIANFKRGLAEYVMGYHPLIQILRFFSRIPSPPFFTASFMRTVGYFYAMLKGEPFAVTKEVVNFFREEQMRRLLNILSFKKK